MVACYKCWSTGQDVQCCGMCHKYMCDKCRANIIQRSIDAAYEKIFGYAKDWAPDGQC